MKFLHNGNSTRRQALVLLGSGMVAGLGGMTMRPLLAVASDLPPVTIYKDPSCGCCGIWTDYLKAHGFTTKVVMTEDMDPIKRGAGVPDNIATCHTAYFGNYVVEGHVPVPAIMKLLTERPNVLGIGVPGMPNGAPGMPTTDPEPFQVLTFAVDGTQKVYMAF